MSATELKVSALPGVVSLMRSLRTGLILLVFVTSCGSPSANPSAGEASPQPAPSPSVSASADGSLVTPSKPTEAIAFSVGGDATALGEVHLVNADGTGDRVIGHGSCPTFSRNGNVVAYWSGSRTTAKIMVAAPDGSSPRSVLGIGESEFALSPDGTRIAWFRAAPMIESPTSGGGNFGYSQTELWVKPVSGGPGIRIARASSDVKETFQSLAWSPDGRQIAFAVNTIVIAGGNVGQYRSAINVVDADGSNLRRLTGRPGTDGVGFTWSPDGRHLAYVGIPDGTPVPTLGTDSDPEVAARLFWPPQDVFVINADGSEDRNLTQTEIFEFDPTWSPDGVHIAYRTFDGSSPRTATLEMRGSVAIGPPSVGPAADSFEWSPSGAQLMLITMTYRSTARARGGPEGQAGFSGRFRLVDPEFRRDPVTLLVVNNAHGCPPSWQGLAP